MMTICLLAYDLLDGPRACAVVIGFQYNFLLPYVILYVVRRWESAPDPDRPI